MAHTKAIRLAVVTTDKAIEAARRHIAQVELDAGMQNRGSMTDDEVAQWCVQDTAQKQFAKDAADATRGYVERVRAIAPGAFPGVKK